MNVKSLYIFCTIFFMTFAVNAATTLRSVMYDPGNSNVVNTNINLSVNVLKAIQIERNVWRAGNSTNLTIPWASTNRIIYTPSNGPVAITMSGTAGNGTNEQVIHVTLILTNSATTTVLFPTNEFDGSAPFVMTAPSTNEFDFIYNGDTFYISSGQSPVSGNGDVLVVNTNPVIYSPIIRYTPTLISGTGGSSTNFTLLSTNTEMYVDNPTALSITASMGYNDSLVDYWTLIATNGSGTNRTIQFVATTNNWRFNGVYGTNAPSVITNNTRLEIAGRQKGTNVQVVYSYTPWP